MDLAMDRWRGSTARERANLATRLAGQLPSGFALDAIERHRLGEAENEVASFRFGSSRFALVPGGPVALGFAGRAT